MQNLHIFNVHALGVNKPHSQHIIVSNVHTICKIWSGGLSAYPPVPRFKYKAD